jgi:hypothetical protein
MSTPHRCWVILVGSVPTSFRAKEREDLVPTFKQLQRTQPEVTLRWFERGRVWENPDAARAASLLVAEAAKVRRPRRDPALGPPRGKEWRPGGEHKDPRARFELTRDQKRAKFKRNLIAGNDSADAPEAAAPIEERAPRAERPARSDRSAPRAERPASAAAPVKKRPAGDPFA